jgi:hypothetical protein
MELALDSDVYCPSVDVMGNYIDVLPSFLNMKNGMRCPCGTRRDKTYDNSSSFSIHMKTKTHQKWLANLNLNKTNYFVENISLQETVNSQKQIISKLEKELQNRMLTIDYLTKQLVVKNNCEIVDNLLEFD